MRKRAARKGQRNIMRSTLLVVGEGADDRAFITHMKQLYCPRDSGISVKVQSERSQHANKRLALLLIARRLVEQAEQASEALRAERRLFHHQVQRGNPQRTFKGERFEASP